MDLRFVLREFITKIMQNPPRPGTEREREVKNNAMKPNREHNLQIPMWK